MPLWPAPLVPDTQVKSAIQEAKDALLIDTSTDDYLTRIGQNYGIRRPPHVETDDPLYRKIIKTLAWLPKGTLFCFYKLLEAIFGTQADIILAGHRPWRVYEVNANEVIVEVPTLLVVSDNERSSYLHGYSGFATGTLLANSVDVPGDARESSATTLVGKYLSVRINGTWESQPISTVTYNSGPDTTTLGVAPAFSMAPTAGDPAYVEVPGDNVASYRGDYLATDGFATTFSTAAGPPTTTATLLGDVSTKVRQWNIVTFRWGGTSVSRTVASVAYNVATNRTTLVLTATLDGGIVSGTASLPMEVADTSSAPHDDRVYLTGSGLLSIFQYYMLELARVSGIVVRYEEV